MKELVKELSSFAQKRNGSQIKKGVLFVRKVPENNAQKRNVNKHTITPSVIFETLRLTVIMAFFLTRLTH